MKRRWPVSAAQRLRVLALAITLANPVLITAVTAWRYPGSLCAGKVDITATVLMVVALPLSTLANPYRAITASLVYLHLAAFLSLESCPLPRDHNRGLTLLILPFLVLYLLLATLIGGVLLRRLVHPLLAWAARSWRARRRLH